VQTGILKSVLGWNLIACACIASSPLRTLEDRPAKLKIVHQRVERENPNEVHFWLKVINESGRPVVLTAIGSDNPRPYPLFLEQWRPKDGWTAVAPCIDVPPPALLTLNSGESLAVDFVLTTPPSRICNEPNLQLKGRFRYRLDYFGSEEEARAYAKKVYSPGVQPGRAAVALSQPFEIAPLRKQ
jgi:hypothetical protein